MPVGVGVPEIVAADSLAVISVPLAINVGVMVAFALVHEQDDDV
jgi:hypothetical protein